MEVGRVRGVEEVEAAKVEAISTGVHVALLEVGNLSAMEAAMFERVPHAGGRLKFIADSGAAAMAEVVMGMGRSMQ